MSALRVEIRHRQEIEESLHQAVQGWLRQEFDDEFSAYAWSEGDWQVLGWEGERLVFHADITERTASVGGSPVRVGGIGGVVTRAELRRRGIASAALRKTGQFLMDELAVDFGLLICDPALTPFYRLLGWQDVAVWLACDQPGGKITLDGAVLALPCRQSAWPSGPIDLCGLPW